MKTLELKQELMNEYNIEIYTNDEQQLEDLILSNCSEYENDNEKSNEPIIWYDRLRNVDYNTDYELTENEETYIRRCMEVDYK